MSAMPPQPPDDATLIARVARRDRSAFELLYDRHASKALGLSMRVCAERTIAEEIVQEAFWRVWTRAATFDTARGNFVTWLLGIVHHLTIDHLRQQRGRPPLVAIESDRDEASFDIRDERHDVAEQAWTNLRNVEMRDALTRLPEAQRVVIELAYFEGLTRQEIAEKLREPLGTIHTRARLGLMKLKELLPA
ncbi:MAG: sigma-70 family RNA polymerase sigma factor [Chloroflexota bacterium]